MGFQDRDYYREESEWEDVRPSSAGMTWVTRLVILNVAIYFADLIISDRSHWFMRGMAVHADTWAHVTQWWKFLTYGFAHDPNKIVHLACNMFGLWVFGRPVERQLGGMEFVRFYLITLVLGSVAWVARLNLFGLAPVEGVGPSLIGASGAVTAVIVLFVCHFPHEKVLLLMLLPVPAWVFGLLLVLGDLSGAVGGTSASNVAFDVHLVGAALGGAYYRFRWNFGRYVSWKALSGGRWRLQRAPRLRVHHGTEEGGPDLESQYREMDDEADRILAKLHERGDASLTEQERRILEDYSRRMRQKHR